MALDQERDAYLTEGKPRPLLGLRLDLLTDGERRGLPDGTRAEERMGVVVNEYVKDRGRWKQSMNRGLVPASTPWMARITHLPERK